MAGKASDRAKAIQGIAEAGALLVFPISNKKDPASIWYKLNPRTAMRWEWTEDGDDRVPKLWHLREELSRSKEVVYSKWYQGRATFFSRELFVNLAAYLRPDLGLLSHDSKNILDALQLDSPLSTKQIKVAAELQGKMNESLYNKAMKKLWNHLVIVGFGEIEDSSFPSLAVGATQSIFEDLWLQSEEISESEGEKYLLKKLGAESPFFKYAQKVKHNEASR